MFEPSSTSTTRCVCAVVLVLGLAAALEAVPPSSNSSPTDQDTSLNAAGAAEASQAMNGFRKPQGWRVSLFAAEPELANPVALYVDRQSRVFVCESFRQDNGVTDNRGHDKQWLHADLAAQSVQDRIAYHRRLLGDKVAAMTAHEDRIRLLSDTNGDGLADRATIFADQFNQLEDGTGAGVLEHNGDVFYTCIPKLWRLRDNDQDGVADQREALYDGFGVRVAFRGHDMHGLVIGPDGRLYFSIGDRGYNVQTDSGKFINPESGAVFRCELDGSQLELFATGLRNPQELAFDDWGNLFTGDNNSDSGDKARWVNVLEGGDTGWRMMYQYISDRGPFNREKIWLPYSADQTPAYVVPPVANIADGPSGLTYYPGTGLTKEYQNCFFLVDFRGGPSNSGIRLVKLKPQGAFWEIERNEQLIWNVLATDCDFGPDGALWVCDWVDGWVGEGKGRIYRFFHPASQSSPVALEVAALLKDGFQDLDAETLGLLLHHEDRRIRSGAQLELAARGESQQFAVLAANGKADLLARLHAVWGLAQVARTQAGLRATHAGILTRLLGDADPAVRAAAAAGLGDAGLGAAVVPAETAAGLVLLLDDAQPRVRYAAALACGKLQIDSAFGAVLKLLEENADEDPALRHAGIMALKGQSDSTRLVGLAQHPARSVRLAAVVALRKRLDPRVSQFLSDADQSVQTEAARAVNDVPELHAALESLARVALPAGASDALVHRVLNANYRLGDVIHAQAVASLAVDSTCSEAMRREALEMLRQWGQPGDLDRIMNRHHPIAARPSQPAQDALAAVLQSAMQASQELASLALSVAADLNIAAAAPYLKELALDTDRPSMARVDAIQSTLRLDASLAKTIVKQLIADKQPTVRAAALQGYAQLDPVAATPWLAEATQSEAVIERQTAWDALASIDTPEATQIIADGLQAYMAGQLPADVWLNVLEASEGRVGAAALAARTAFEDAQAETDSLARYRDCLTGGNAKAGEEIFMTRTELSCVRCHKVGRRGGEVGPALTEIAKTKDSRYLLEAIVNPDAKIAENFETALILTEDGQLLTGIIKRETPEVVSLMDAEGKLVDIPTESIAERKKGKSSMPADLIKHMNRRQLRDLVAYLSSLKGRRP